jgi:hypothetical protein
MFCLLDAMPYISSNKSLCSESTKNTSFSRACLHTQVYLRLAVSPFTNVHGFSLKTKSG